MLQAAAKVSTNLESFELRDTDYSTHKDATVWCDAISKLISNQKNLKVASLSFPEKCNEIKVQSVMEALCTQARSLRTIEIQSLDMDLFYIIKAICQCPNLQEIDLSFCKLCLQYPLQLPMDAFPNLCSFYLFEVKTNSYGIYTLLGNLKK